MSKKNTFYITTAIPYANASPHIGFALEILYADVMARYQRLLGHEVYFLTGTDEHGQKMLKTAREANRSVEEFAAEKSAEFMRLADEWNISNNDFIRTTEQRHETAAQKFWQLVDEKGYIFKKSYTGLYCYGCESFKTEKDLVDGKCPDHNRTPEIVSEENYFFKLSAFQKQLEAFFDEHPDFVVPPNRYREMNEILKSGLDDVSISRSKEKLPWGIPVPGDDSQVMYVWFDALSNYITALGWGKEDDELYKKFWPANAHVIGKDINRFHSLLWPAMLMAAGLELPKQISVHGFIYVDGKKMSKSIGNVVDPAELIRVYPLEAVRYFLMREIPFDNDGNFSEKQFIERYNGDLANGLGNLTNRILTMIEKYAAGQIPAPTEPDDEFIDYVKKIWEHYKKVMTEWRIDLALEATWKFVAHCDQLISDRQPWAMAKNGKTEQVQTLLYHLAEALRHIAIMIFPVMPETGEKILQALGLDVGLEIAKPLDALEQWVDIPVGTIIKKGEPLFPRLLLNEK